MKIHDNAVVIGDINPSLEAEEGSVVIVCANDKLVFASNTQIAIGRNAHATGPNTIAIGAGAIAGDEPLPIEAPLNRKLLKDETYE
jgi:Head domain of trimeric autotransporter adhesin